MEVELLQILKDFVASNPWVVVVILVLVAIGALSVLRAFLGGSPRVIMGGGQSAPPSPPQIIVLGNGETTTSGQRVAQRETEMQRAHRMFVGNVPPVLGLGALSRDEEKGRMPSSKEPGLVAHKDKTSSRGSFHPDWDLACKLFIPRFRK